MTQDELNTLLKNDPYLIARKEPTPSENALYLAEVTNICPLCGTSLTSGKNNPKRAKLYQIAHIYPNRPTIEQYQTLDGVLRRGNNSEDFDNKIALCLACHHKQDYHTLREEYEKLYKIKGELLQRDIYSDLRHSNNLQDELENIVNELTSLNIDMNSVIRYKPFAVYEKIPNNLGLLQRKVVMYVSDYYKILRELFSAHEGINDFSMNCLCSQFKTMFLELQRKNASHEDIFDQIVLWVKQKSKNKSTEACEVIVSFFIQNCEVYSEITK